MQTLHSENFIEFSILRYIIMFFVFCILAAAVIGRKKLVYTLFILFVLFCILAMVDFYRWNYNYGHNLDPHAAIKVPGMSYQPPVIGYKQLLNFGAYSIPDTGGILFIAAGVLILLVVLIERNVFAKWFKTSRVAAMLMMVSGLFAVNGCSAPAPRPLRLNEDACEFCKMIITEAQYATQLSTIKGRQYVFDDILCMAEYKKSNPKMEFARFYVADFCQASDFIDVDRSVLIQSDSLRSPMGGNIAGFSVKDSAEVYEARFGASKIKWVELIR